MSLGRDERGYAAALASCVVWALVPVGTRFFVLRVDPFVFNVVRFLASGAAALPLFLYARPWAWSRRDKVLLAACALLAVPGYNIPVALGARTVTAGGLGVLIATEPVIIATLTLLLHRRPIHSRVIVGSLLAFAGVTLTSGLFTSVRSSDWLSMLEVLFGALCWSLYTVLAVRLNQRYGTFGVTGSILVVGTAVLLAVSLPLLPSAPLPDRSTLWALAGMGIASSLLGFLLWNYAGALLPSERLGLFLYLLPVVSVLAGVEFLSESLTLQILAGAALTLFGVWFAARAPRALPAVIADKPIR